MTRRKINILLSIISIFLSFSLFGFGVYASVAVNSTINNTFRYEVPADDFSVRILGRITGCRNEENFDEFLEHQKDSQITTYPNYYNVEFVEVGAGQYQDIVFTFKIANYNAYPITAVIQSNTQSQYFSSTPSSQITVGAYRHNGQNWVAEEGEISLTLSLTTTENFNKESNSFTIVFGIAE